MIQDCGTSLKNEDWRSIFTPARLLKPLLCPRKGTSSSVLISRAKWKVVTAEWIRTKSERMHFGEILMKILLANDDGVLAPGIRALYQELSPHFSTTIIAPLEERSTTGHSLSLDKPLRLEKLGE